MIRESLEEYSTSSILVLDMNKDVNNKAVMNSLSGSMISYLQLPDCLILSDNISSKILYSSLRELT